MKFDTNGEVKQRRKPATDLVYGKVPPQVKEVEMAVLGALLLDSYCLPSVIGLLFVDAFYVDAHQKIYSAILKLYDGNKKIDTLTVVEQLKADEVLEIVGGPYYVVTLTNQVVSTANIEYHAMLVIQKYLGRELIRICGEGIGDAYEDSTDIISLYEKTDNELINVQERVLSASMQDMSYYSKKVYEEYETVKSTGVLGIQTGIKPLDAMICGLVAPDLIIIAARPSMGKTALALSITHYTSILHDIPCAWFSLEMNGSQLTMRLAAIDSGLNHKEIRQGKISTNDETLLFNSLDRIGKAPIYIEDKGVINIRTIRTRTHILKRKHKIQYIVVDYLQLMSAVDPKNKNREAVVSEISRSLKELARELNMPIIALSQLSRAVEARPDKMPQLSDLRESGGIEQDADEVIFLMRPEWYQFTEPVQIKGKDYDVRGLCIGKTAKNRHGDCENFAMWFEGRQMLLKTHPNDMNYNQTINHIPEYKDFTEPNNKFEENPF